MKAPDTLSLTLAALADPTRRAILERLAQGETFFLVTEPEDEDAPKENGEGAPP